MYALECPGINIFIFRTELGALKTNYLSSNTGFPGLLQDLIDKKMVKIDNQDNIIRFKNGGKKRNNFASGSSIRLRHMGSDAAVEALTGAEVCVAFIDRFCPAV